VQHVGPKTAYGGHVTRDGDGVEFAADWWELPDRCSGPNSDELVDQFRWGAEDSDVDVFAQAG
jgi:hypothetical protein